VEDLRPTSWQFYHSPKVMQRARSRMSLVSLRRVYWAQISICRQRRCQLTHFWTRKWKVCSFALNFRQDGVTLWAVWMVLWFSLKGVGCKGNNTWQSLILSTSSLRQPQQITLVYHESQEFPPRLNILLFNISIHVVLTSTLRYPKLSLPFRFSNWKFLCISHIPHAPY
jgi:hypothetical protein